MLLFMVIGRSISRYSLLVSGLTVAPLLTVIADPGLFLVPICIKITIKMKLNAVHAIVLITFLHATFGLKGRYYFLLAEMAVKGHLHAL